MKNARDSLQCPVCSKFVGSIGSPSHARYKSQNAESLYCSKHGEVRDWVQFDGCKTPSCATCSAFVGKVGSNSHRKHLQQLIDAKNVKNENKKVNRVVDFDFAGDSFDRGATKNAESKSTPAPKSINDREKAFDVTPVRPVIEKRYCSMHGEIPLAECRFTKSNRAQCKTCSKFVGRGGSPSHKAHLAASAKIKYLYCAKHGKIPESKCLPVGDGDSARYRCSGCSKFVGKEGSPSYQKYVKSLQKEPTDRKSVV